jgi:lysophospholipid acyltransferase
VEELPTFFDYLGFMYYCGGTIAGPPFEYKDYINFIQRKGHYANIPNTIVPTLIRLSHAICKSNRLIKGLVFIVMCALFGDVFAPEYLITEEYASKSFLYKV